MTRLFNFGNGEIKVTVTNKKEVSIELLTHNSEIPKEELIEFIDSKEKIYLNDLNEFMNIPVDLPLKEFLLRLNALSAYLLKHMEGK